MKKLIALVIASTLTISTTFAQSATQSQKKLIDSYNYEQLITARSTIAQKWNNYTPAQKTKIRGYLKLIKARLDILPVPTSSSSVSSVLVSSSSSSEASNSLNFSENNVCAKENILTIRDIGQKLPLEGMPAIQKIMNSNEFLTKYLLIASYCRKNLKSCEALALSKANDEIEKIKSYENELFITNKKVADYNKNIHFLATKCFVNILPIQYPSFNYNEEKIHEFAYDKLNFDKYIYNSDNQTDSKIFEKSILNIEDTINLSLIKGPDFLNVIKNKANIKTSF